MKTQTRWYPRLWCGLVLCLAVAMTPSPAMGQGPALAREDMPCEPTVFSKEIDTHPGCGWTERIMLRGPLGVPAQPIDLVISVDTSYPNEEGLGALTQALIGLIGKVRDAASESGREHRIAVLVHNRTAEVLYGLGSDYEAAMRSLSRLPKYVIGGNCTECALDLAQSTLGPGQTGRRQHIILIERGLPDFKDPAYPEDACDPCAESRTICVQQALERAQEVKAAGVQLHPVAYDLPALDLRCGAVTRQLMTGVLGEMASNPEETWLAHASTLAIALEDVWGSIWSDAALRDVVLYEVISSAYEIANVTPSPSGREGHTLWWSLDRLEPDQAWQGAVELRIKLDAVGDLPFAHRTRLEYTDAQGEGHTKELAHQPELYVDPLSLTCPADIVVAPEQGCMGATVAWEEPGISGGTPPYRVVSSQPSGALFPPGRTRVTCTVTDACGREKQSGFDVTVLPPTIDLAPLPDIHANSNGYCGVETHWELQVTGGTPPVTVVCDPPIGTVFGAGVTRTVTCTATDACGNSDAESFRVVVQGSHRVEQQLYSGQGEELILRFRENAFRGYAGEAASEHDLILIPSPPAPPGWNLPEHAPSGAWRPAKRVWWDEWAGWWAAGSGGRLPKPGTAIGTRDATDKPRGKDWDTHLIRRTFAIHPPAQHMRLTSARLAAWSDNKSAWWWQGDQLPLAGQGFVGEVELAEEYMSPRGGEYVLAIQTSNDRIGGLNPHGTAFELRLVWDCSALPGGLE